MTKRPLKKPRAKIKAGPSPGEQLFAIGWRVWVSELPGEQPAREYHFHPSRDWRFDFAFPERLVAVEIEGATFAGGRHSRGAGFRDDCHKYNAAAGLGWRVFRFTTDMIQRDLVGCVQLVADSLGAE
jgi:hypothetical protein